MKGKGCLGSKKSAGMHVFNETPVLVALRQPVFGPEHLGKHIVVVDNVQI